MQLQEPFAPDLILTFHQCRAEESFFGLQKNGLLGITYVYIYIYIQLRHFLHNIPSIPMNSPLH